jgi:hypothetical protein
LSSAFFKICSKMDTETLLFAHYTSSSNNFVLASIPAIHFLFTI